MPNVLSFKIPTLDQLFAPELAGKGIPLPVGPNTTSLCLIGPDGTGKSVFSLHLARAYYASLRNERATDSVRVLYVSTDLKFHRAEQVLKNFTPDKPTDDAALTELSADVKMDSVCNYLMETNGDPGIGFVDLAASTAGDDWGLVNRLLASVPDPADGKPPHLLLIDAVEGLETLVGESDAFGLRCTRRQRVANLMRLAEKKAHVVFVVEEAEPGKRHPEEFVADCVVRLRTWSPGSFTRRTIEIEKARAVRGYAHGQHPFRIGKDRYAGEPARDVVEVFPALPSVVDQRIAPADMPAHKFDLKYLDEMLNEGKGARPGEVVAIVGEASTLKSDLGFRFLAGASKGRSERSGLAILLASDPGSEERLKNVLGTEKLADWIRWRPFFAADLPAAEVYWKIRARLEYEVRQFAKSHSEGTFVHRLVIDDLSSFRDTYPEIAQDPLFLPKLVRFLENGIEVGDGLHFFVTVLISTQDGRPGVQPADRFDQSLRDLVPLRIQTWHVQFYDQQRVAISTNTAAHETGPVVVRELCRREVEGKVVLFVNPHFELYRDLELGKPERVALEIRMFAETEAFDRYIEAENHLLNDLFLPRNASAPGASVITRVPADQYESLRDYCNVTAGTNSEHTLILQVDGFWDPSGHAFRLLDQYLTLPIAPSTEKLPDPEEDCLHVFDFSTKSAHEMDSRRKAGEASGDATGPTPEGLRRSDFFVIHGRTRRPPPDRVPFMWDYGFLLLDRDAWSDAAKRKLETLSRRNAKLQCGGAVSVEDVWNVLRIPTEGRPKDILAKKEKEEKGEKERYDPRNLHLDPDIAENGIPITSWRVFLEATLEVARVARLGRKSPVQAFDSSQISGESISALILEMWMSEIYLQKKRREFRDPEAEPSAADFAKELAASPGDGRRTLILSDLLKEHQNELYMVFLLLVEVMDFERLVEPEDPYRFQVRPGTDAAVAARHWYKTAVISDETQFKDRPSMPARLPGHFSVRGDWYLAVSAGSRSARLANLGLDFLNSRRANLTRLQRGLGLPVRDICPMDAYAGLRTALTYFSEHDDNPDRNRRVTLPYWDLFAELGACAGWLRGPLERTEDEFNWLWRDRILEYGRHARIWLNFLLSMIRFWRRVRTDESGIWQSGFDAYDEMYAGLAKGASWKPAKEEKRFRSFSGFQWRVEQAIHELDWNSRQLAKDNRVKPK